MKGLFNKYTLTRTDGKEILPDDKFIILRYSRDDEWGSLCRFVLNRLCRQIEDMPDRYPELQQFAKDLQDDIFTEKLKIVDASASK